MHNAEGPTQPYGSTQRGARSKQPAEQATATDPAASAMASSATPYLPEGGDEVCWMNRVCPECGGLAETAPPVRCPRCGILLDAD